MILSNAGRRICLYLSGRQIPLAGSWADSSAPVQPYDPDELYHRAFCSAINEFIQ